MDIKNVTVLVYVSIGILFVAFMYLLSYDQRYHLVQYLAP